jgi:peptidoglycan/xylan/chitin deacetylase (PgdA/CDA1 family)
MFHHFHDGKLHKASQGSINAKELRYLIDYIGRKNIINSEEFYSKVTNKEFQENKVCISFDDGLKSQFDIALPVLKEFDIKAFFFIYSSIFTEETNLLEVFRYFRSHTFHNINEFYELFFSRIDNEAKSFLSKNINEIETIKFKFPFYSQADIEFRLLRDKYLSEEKYKEIMFELFKIKNFDYEELKELLFINAEDLKTIYKLGHTIGLHSHSHPTCLEDLSYPEQEKEYKLNKKILAEIIEQDSSQIIAMSHPCGSYNQDTLSILEKLGIKLGFKQIMNIEHEKGMKRVNNSRLEIARIDHSELMKRMKIQA